MGAHVHAHGSQGPRLNMAPQESCFFETGSLSSPELADYAIQKWPVSSRDPNDFVAQFWD